MPSWAPQEDSARLHIRSAWFEEGSFHGVYKGCYKGSTIEGPV